MVRTDEMHRRVFEQEVSLTAYLSDKYPFFPKIYGYDLDSQLMVLKYYRAGSLHTWMPRVRWSRWLCVRILCDVAGALQAMHGENMAHCDIKPDNVLIDLEPHSAHSDQVTVRAVLSDLGIARILTRSAELAVKHFRAVLIRGLSIMFAAPDALLAYRRSLEGLRDVRTPDVMRACDVYSLACVMFQCVTTVAPWDQVTTTATMSPESSSRLLICSLLMAPSTCGGPSEALMQLISPPP